MLTGALEPLLAKWDAPDSYAKGVRQAAPSVASIHTITAVKSAPNPLLEDPLFRNFFELPTPGSQPQLESSIGSGVIVDADGYILTNHHVVRAADGIQVALADGRVADASVVGSDPETDIAVLKINQPRLTAIRIADSNDVKVGDVVLAIGNPLGIGQTVTQGIVSATGRNRVGINTFENFIQTDAAINPGNSGGALINVAGEMVGVNSAILGYEGIGFAIPTSIAVKVMLELVASGGVERGWLGIQARDMTSSLRRDLRATSGAGIAILAVKAGGPAHLAGLRPGDIITKIGDRLVSNSVEAMETIAQLPSGVAVQVFGSRMGEAINVQVFVSRRPREISGRL